MGSTSISVLFLLSIMFLLAVDIKAQQNPSNVIPLGSWLSPISNRTSWFSPSGLFAFGFYPQGKGYAVGIWLVNQSENIIVWTANRDNPPVSSTAVLNLTSDGPLLRTEQGEENLTTGMSDTAVSASMHDSGNFVLNYNSTHIVWESFDYPTDTILGGQNLSNGNDLVSSVSISDHSRGRFYLTIETEGDLVSYPVNNTANSENAYWSSGIIISSASASTSTSGSGRPICKKTNIFSCRGQTDDNSIKLSLSQSGFLSLTDGSSSIYILGNNSYSAKKETGITIIYRAILDSDGILKLYSHHFLGNSTNVSLEGSSLSDQCQVKGFCGFNSYCIGTGFKAECRCYPGFHFLDTGNKLLGCNNSFIEDGCSSSTKDPIIPYDIEASPNLFLADYPYSMVRTKQENCNKSCLEDCNCGAALFYMNGTCNKYKLPLRYGKRSQNLSEEEETE